MAKRKRSRGKSAPAKKPARRKVSAKKPVQPADGAPKTRSFDWTRLQAGIFPFLILALVAFGAYYNAWPNNLAGDDARFAIADRYTSLGIADTWRFFGGDLWAVDGASSGLYRPLLLFSIWIDAQIYGDWVAGYHLSNILLHILATLLVFGFVRYLLQHSDDRTGYIGLAALGSAILFAVHPIHAEAVNSIFNRSEIMVTIGALAGLWWFLKTWPVRPVKAWIGLTFLYLVMLLCRESGVTLPALVVLLLWFYSSGSWKSRVLHCLPAVLLIIPLALYLALRSQALSDPEPEPRDAVVVEQSEQIPVRQPTPAEAGAGDSAESSERTQPPQAGSANNEDPSGFSKLLEFLRDYPTDRLSYAPRFWAEGLKLLAWPQPLMFIHGRTEISLPAALMWHAILLGLALFALARAGPAPLVGLLIFYITLLPSSGLVGMNFMPPMAERYLYLPSAGWALALGFLLLWAARRFSPWPPIAAVCFATLVLTPLTWARNAEWVSDVSLVEADYAKGRRHGLLYSALVKDNLAAGNLARANEVCMLHNHELAVNWPMARACAKAFIALGKFQQAEDVLITVIGAHHGTSVVHMDLASLYLRLGRRAEARSQYQEAVAVETRPFYRELLQGLILMNLYPNDRGRLLEAREHMKQALVIEPQFAQARTYLDQIEKRLDR